MQQSAKVRLKQILILFVEGLREIFAHQCRFQGHVSAYLVLFRISLYSTCLENKKAVPAKAPDINLAFHPDDNHRLIVHECAAFEPCNAQDLPAILDFISSRTNPNRPAPERLHAVW